MQLVENLSLGFALHDWMHDVGPEDFLRAYAVMAGLAIGWGLALRLLRFDYFGHGPDESLTAYESAYLAGGESRLAHSVLARLVRAECIEVRGGGDRLWLGKRKLEKPDLLEASVLEIAHAGGGIKDALRGIQHADYGLIDELERQGLARPWSSRFVAGVIAILPLLMVLGLGVWRGVIGVGRDKPIGFLVMMSVAWGLIAIVLLCTENRRTPTGSRVLRKTRKQRPKKLHRNAASSRDWAWVAGLYGLNALPSDALSLQQAIHPEPTGGSGTGCGGGGSGSGCGGGGGCGG